MTEREFKDKMDALKNSCRVYKHEQAILDEHNINKSDHFGDEKLLSYIKEDIAYVEDTFSKIESKFGKSARLIVWMLFVEDKTQQDVAENFGLSRRQLQYSLGKWLHAVLE